MNTQATRSLAQTRHIEPDPAARRVALAVRLAIPAACLLACAGLARPVHAAAPPATEPAWMATIPKKTANKPMSAPEVSDAVKAAQQLANDRAAAAAAATAAAADAEKAQQAAAQKILDAEKAIKQAADKADEAKTKKAKEDAEKAKEDAEKAKEDAEKDKEDKDKDKEDKDKDKADKDKAKKDADDEVEKAKDDDKDKNVPKTADEYEEYYVVVGCNDKMPPDPPPNQTLEDICSGLDPTDDPINPVKPPLPIPPECYHTRLENQVINAKLCAKITPRATPHRKEDDDDRRKTGDKDEDKRRAKERSEHHEKAVEDDKDNDKYKENRRCAGDVRLDADGTHNGKDDKDDKEDDHERDYDDGYGNKVEKDELVGGEPRVRQRTDIKPTYATYVRYRDKDNRVHFRRRDDHGPLGEGGHDVDDDHEHSKECDDDKAQGCEKYETKASEGKKVTICHVPPGNPENAHTITVSQNALRRGHMIAEAGESKDLNERHRMHNDDYFGPCTKTIKTTENRIVTEPLPPILVPKTKLPLVIEEFRACLDPLKGGGSKAQQQPSSGAPVGWQELVK